MKKIGILTFHNANNYGAVLQAYALKLTLGKLGNTAHILNYYCPKIQREYKGIPPFKKNFFEILKYPFKLLLLPLLKARVATGFTKFRKQYLLDTPPILPGTIEKNTQSYDMFICGSDQVFNPRITNFDANYFLAFSQSKIKNYSYAASFGLSLECLLPAERAFCKKHLAHLNKISVREEQGAQIVKTLSAQQSVVHIDPTLLLSKTDWESLAIAPKEKHYILLYLLSKDPDLVHLAQQLAQEKGYKLLFISKSIHFRKSEKASYIMPTPQEWLGLFQHADYILTNSFHGLVFSVNFNKSFVVARALGKREKFNSRLDNLLEITGLQDRLYTSFTQTDIFDKTINWQNVNKIVAQQRQKSMIYLKEISK